MLFVHREIDDRK